MPSLNVTPQAAAIAQALRVNPGASRITITDCLTVPSRAQWLLSRYCMSSEQKRLLGICTHVYDRTHLAATIPVSTTPHNGTPAAYLERLAGTLPGQWTPGAPHTPPDTYLPAQVVSYYPSLPPAAQPVPVDWADGLTETNPQDDPGEYARWILGQLTLPLSQFLSAAQDANTGPRWGKVLPFALRLAQGARQHPGGDCVTWEGVPVETLARYASLPPAVAESIVNETTEGDGEL